MEIARRALDQDGTFLLLWQRPEILTSLPAARYAGLHALEPLPGPQSDITGLEERDEVGQIGS